MEGTVRDGEDIVRGGESMMSISSTDSPQATKSEGSDSATMETLADGVTEIGALDDIKEEVNGELELMPMTIHYQPSLSDFSDDSREEGDVKDGDGKTCEVPSTEGITEPVEQDDKDQGPGTGPTDQCLDSESTLDEDPSVIKNEKQILEDVEEVVESGDDSKAENLETTFDHKPDSDVVSQDGKDDGENDGGIAASPAGSNTAVDVDPAGGADWDVDIILDHGLDTDDELEERLPGERSDNDFTNGETYYMYHTHELYPDVSIVGNKLIRNMHAVG